MFSTGFDVLTTNTSPLDPVIQSVFKNVYSGEQIQKVEDSYAGFTRYVWTEPASGKKKLRIQKYSDTCGILSEFRAFFFSGIVGFSGPSQKLRNVEGARFKHLDLVLF